MVPAAVLVGDPIAGVDAVRHEVAGQGDDAVTGEHIGLISHLDVGQSGKVLRGVVGDDVADRIVVIQQGAVEIVNHGLTHKLNDLVLIVISRGLLAPAQQGDIDPGRGDHQAALHVFAVVHLRPDLFVLRLQRLHLG